MKFRSPPRILPPLPLIFPAMLSGGLVTLCFPVTSLGPVSLLALAPLFAALLRHQPGRRDSFRAGFLMGATSFVTMMWWIVRLNPAADATIPFLSKVIPPGLTMPLLLAPALILLVLYLALYPGLHVLVLAAVTRWRPGAFVLAAPPAWVVLEIVRSRGELAFPWGVLGYSLSGHPSLVQSATLCGVYGLSFGIVLINALLATALAARGPRLRAGCGLLAGVIAAAVVVDGEHRAESARAVAGDSLRVSIAQPNIDLAIKWKPEYRDSSFRQIERQAAQARDAGARLVVFPETCAPMYVENDPRAKSRLRELSQTLDVPIYVGFLDHRFDGPGESLNIFNSSGVFRPDGKLEKYDKRHLLPFGESLPLSTRWRRLRKLNFGQANFQPGPKRPPLDAGAVKFTPLICFESVFPELCREGVRDGSQLFVNITNDGWFGDTPGPHQHAQMCILRAVEFRRYLIRSANSGVSMIVDPSGEVTHALGLYHEAVLTSEVALLAGETFYARHGDRPLLAGSVVMIVAAALVARRRRGREGAPSPPAAGLV